MNLSKTVIAQAILLAANAAVAAPLPEGSYPQQPSLTSEQAPTRAEVAAATSAWIERGKPGLIPAEERPELVPPHGAPASRLEVTVEHDLWQRSGLAARLAAEPTPDFGAAELRKQLANYEAAKERDSRIAHAQKTDDPAGD